VCRYLDKTYTDLIGNQIEKPVEIMRETVEVVRKLWTEQEVSYRGKFFTYKGTSIESKLVQKPCPPIWFAAFGPRMLRITGELGDGFITQHIPPRIFKEELDKVRETAKKVGNEYVINGEKTYISGVIEATKRGGGHITLFRTAPELGNKGMTFAYIPAKLPGISYTTFRDMGRMGLSTGGFSYKDVKIPAKYVLGQENRGFYVNMEGFNVARTLVASQARRDRLSGCPPRRSLGRRSTRVRCRQSFRRPPRCGRGSTPPRSFRRSTSSRGDRAVCLRSNIEQEIAAAGKTFDEDPDDLTG
jgi:hypothetical protein